MKNPRPPAHVSVAPTDLHRLPEQTALFRILFTRSPYAVPFGALRHWGPSEIGGRWDPHEGRPDPATPGGPRGDLSQDRGVLYVATSLRTCLAEVFQNDDTHLSADSPRVIDLLGSAPALHAWRTTRPLDLLDLTGDWALRHGASASLTSADHLICQAWARRIAEAVPDLDGLWVTSTMTGEPMPVLFHGALEPTSFPGRPGLSRHLADPVLADRIRAAADAIGYALNTP